MDLSSQDAHTRQSLVRSAVVATGLGGFVLLALASGTAALTGFDRFFILSAIAVYVPAAAVIVVRITPYHPHARFGAANLITLGRLIITCLLAGLAVEITIASAQVSPLIAWCLLIVAVVGLILDGLDGPVARREGLASRFGSRFDMEVDALQILVLSVVAFALVKAGWWILLSGLLRYLFVVASALWPALRGDLPASWRRKIISGIQGGVLAALLAPIIVPPLSTAAAGIALILLVYSFGIDTLWLARKRESAR